MLTKQSYTELKEEKHCNITDYGLGMWTVGFAKNVITKPYVYGDELDLVMQACNPRYLED